MRIEAERVVDVRQGLTVLFCCKVKFGEDYVGFGIRFDAIGSLCFLAGGSGIAAAPPDDGESGMGHGGLRIGAERGVIFAFGFKNQPAMEKAIALFDERLGALRGRQ